ncbi:hypothetical protein Lesp02_36910 [Lentzea sp. NBRC 105346]|uniref:DUF3558 domain-containing protein n=1 Tax=Lentzea sp. NBRC 105346 TaxID=3032205 RepID=UPI0024A1512B|nr:DUF3558 domain-containing protein [Lentzea sp. NBRC 105346]GLZ31503.1 hypothetical protein Lesp02_36910 [Lentzea sp. NBRC 105346]
MRRVALLFALAVTVTGCSEPTTGTPSAGDQTSATSGSQTKAPTSSKAAVSRPKKIDLKPVQSDICSLLTDAQRQQFGLKKVEESRPSSFLKDAKRCAANTDDNLIPDYTAVTGEGVEKYSSGNGVSPAQVGGFPAYKRADDHNCALAIDVADGQMLMVSYSTISSGKGDVLCQKVTPFAEAVMATLLSR